MRLNFGVHTIINLEFAKPNVVIILRTLDEIIINRFSENRFSDQLLAIIFIRFFDMKLKINDCIY